MTRPKPFRHAPGIPVGFVNGRAIFPIAGGSGEGDTPPAATPPPAEPPKPAPPAEGATLADLIAERDKWKALSKKHEAGEKSNADAAKELAELKRQTQSESERSVADARAEGEKAASEKYRSAIARHALNAAAATERVAVPEAVIGRLNLADLVGDDGEVDEAALKELVAGFAPIEQAPPEPDPRRRVVSGQGPRSSSKDRGGSVAAGRDLYAERHQKKT
ncbi:hypothetical protein [Streptodolium elevatio]|uniref:Scaffolding protein n=1 Tax=Streptodolium elevatio TaxID=3157996 RepID=A0ABV3DM95_9ACTN